MIDTFSWKTRKTAQGSESVSTYQAQFGDGYKQIAGNGLNSVSETWNLDWAGGISDVKILRDFLHSHVTSSFFWTNPWGEKKLYRVKSDSVAVSFLTGKKATLSFIFEQAVAP